MTTQAAIDNALRALPHLVRCAQLGETITYGGLTAKIGEHHRAARPLLCYIRDEICVRRGLPLLTAIVVNKNTGLPGQGWLPEGAHRRFPEDDKAEHEARSKKVFDYAGWDALLKEMRLAAVQPTDDELDKEGRTYADRLEQTGQVGERAPHRMLKEYVARNPGAIGVQQVERVEQEYMFISGDRCDVVFDLAQTGNAVVEVKNGERGELIKGIYQAVKYRALMEAEKGHGQPYPVNAYLVAYDYVPDDIETLAARLQVECHAISRSAVDTL